MPRTRNDSATSQTEQDYIIAKRTRSKISLAETPIEAIEQTFKAPDAPLDMYQNDMDDPYWKDFLTRLVMPMGKIALCNEYVVFAVNQFLKKIVFFSIGNGKGRRC